MHCVGGAATSMLALVYEPSAKEVLEEVMDHREENKNLIIKPTLPPPLKMRSLVCELSLLLFLHTCNH